MKSQQKLAKKVADVFREVTKGTLPSTAMEVTMV